jgi:Gram-negative bacterial TonB protein C-terminal
MKTKLIWFFTLFALGLTYSQNENIKIVYLDSIGREVSKGSHDFYKTITYNPKTEDSINTDYTKFDEKIKSVIYKNSKNGEVITYYKNGNKQSNSFYKENSPAGKSTSWYENGNIQEEGEYIVPEQNKFSNYKIINFWNAEGKQTVVNGEGFYDLKTDKISDSGNVKNGFKDGEWQHLELKQTETYTDIYEKGKFISGVSIDLFGQKNEYLEIFKQPEPKKGINDFYKYIGKNFNYNNYALKNNIGGKLLIQFVVDKEGVISEIKVIRSLGYGLDEEGIRVLESYGKWKPGEIRGRRAKCTYIIPIILKP